MGGQYFEKRPASARRPARITVTIRGRPFLFQTDSGVFSREGLDRGTELLLESIAVGPCESILCLGCGYVGIGIVSAHPSRGGWTGFGIVLVSPFSLPRFPLLSSGCGEWGVGQRTGSRS